MPNLTIANASPALQTQPTVPQDNSGCQAAEPFGSVLARQRANQESAEGSHAAASPADSAPAESGDAHSPQDVPEVEKDVAGLVLAGLLSPADRVEGNAKTIEADDLAAREPAGTITHPELATLMMPATTMGQDAAKLIPGAIGERGEGKGARPVLQLLTNDQGYGAFAVHDAEAGAIGDEIFQATKGTSGKGAASAVQFFDSTQASLQPLQGEASVLTALPQNGEAFPVSSSSAMVQSQVGTPLTSNAWGDEFSQRVVWMVTQREQTAEMRLNPPHLGPLEVVISVVDDQATAVFTSQHAAVRHAVEQALPKLRDMLADSGITLGNATVSDQLPRERQAAYGGRQQSGAGWPDGAIEAAQPAISHHQPGMAGWGGRRHEGMVDTFA